MKIVVLDGYGLNPGDLSWKEFERLGEITVYDRTRPEEVIERSKGASAIFTNKVVISGEDMKQLPELKYIGVLATGYNVVDIKTARDLGITVTNIPAYSTTSVAQKVFALMLAVTDRVEHYAEENRAGRWSESPDFCYWDTPLMELAGKKLGIIGLGNIGKAVARIGIAFDMNVAAYTSKNQDELPEGIMKLGMDELAESSDIISLHCPLTAETTHLVDKEFLSKMKRGAILINTGRGPLIDEEAVAESLREGHLGAYCADVMSVEPPKSDNPLFSAPNTYITPHIAWATKEARTRLMDIAFANLQAFMAGEPVNQV